MSPITYRIAASFVLTLGLTAFPSCGRSKPAVSVPARPTTQPQVLAGDRFDDAQPNSLEDAYTEDDHLSYGGYEIERSVDPQKGASIATIKRDGKVLIAFRNGGQGKESTRFGLFPLIGGGARQLVIQQHTGGAHCCWVYKIYELTPNLRLLFDSELYKSGDELLAVDLDNDGRYELTQAIMTFDYFHMSHASSVFPRAVFTYDEREKMYLPANRKFADFVLKEIEEDKKRATAIVSGANPGAEGWDQEEYLSAVLKVVLAYIYAGKEKAGWEFYDRQYKLSDKAEMRKDISEALSRDPLFRSIR
jgi:hypothetical protein